MAKTRNNRQKMVNTETIDNDMITNLPTTVIDTILMKLPTRDAVRTSILSRKWRHKWAQLPQFIIDETLWDSLEVQHSSRSTLASILLHFVSHHTGPVVRFELTVIPLESCPQIDNLIMFLSRNRNSIQDLTLVLWSSHHPLPSSIFTCQQLKHVVIGGCRFIITPGFKGFSKLTTLALGTCIISTEATRRLISESPLLEQLHLLENHPPTDLYIDAPNLRSFTFQGSAKSIMFTRVMPLFTSVRIQLYQATTEAFGANLTNFFQCLPSVESLYLNHHSIESFTVIDHKNLPHLKHLKLDLRPFNEMVEMQFTLNLMKSSPNLRSIKIEFYTISSKSKAATMYMEGGDYSDIWLGELKEVKLKYITGTKPELEFIKLLLAKSPTLKKILIEPCPTALDDGCKIFTEVMKFQRISKESEVFRLR